KKSPFAEITRNNVEDYINQLSEDSKPKWGMMTAQHMLEHLELNFLFATGKEKGKITTPEDQLEKYQDSLFNYRAMPQSFKHPLLNKDKTEKLRHADIQQAKEAFLKAWDDY